MGKMKTTVVEGMVEETKTSAEKYAEKKAKKASTVHSESHPEATLKKVVTHTRGKKYLKSKENISSTTLYKLSDAIKMVKESSYSKFDGTMELHLIVKRQGTSAQVTLPFSTGKQKKVEIATEKTLEKLKTGKIDFDLLLATAEMMPKLAIYARLLGPRGLMPNPKNGTVIKKDSDAEKFKGNLITVKTEREQPLIHTSFGKVSQKEEELVKNAECIITALGESKSIIRAFVKSTMSPSVKIQI
ncbi:MAG: hypothetical protein QY322_04465 [bacterium]|nr:MAG: hypothetical protein QY322_04465 [bacterium]